MTDTNPTAPVIVDDRHLRPWVVAVGASAGGLEALQAFFGALEAPTYAAFVVIQHLAPDHRSMMPELLARHTPLPVQEARADEGLQADRVYLMPPGVLMTLQHEHLVFTPRPTGGVPLPIDQFLRSLAADLADRSVAVVLSGSGSDGSAGARALRQAGGYVMAQAPDSAKFDSMPRNTMAATAVDAVLPPAELAARVLALTRGQATRLPSGELVGAESLKPSLQRLFALLHESSGIDFSQYKLPTVMRRIERRIAVLGSAGLGAYVDQVARAPEEAELLRRELLIPVTAFFRDPEAFAALGRALQMSLSQTPPAQALRIWCAGCATGEEAYSVAMLALEACEAVGRWPGLKVFASDIDARFLAVAGAGTYPLAAAEGLPAGRLERFFTARDERITVRPELRQAVLFARHNLLEDAPFTKMDVVVCRNTLIYFQQPAQERVMRRLQYALNPGGLLLLGHSESLGPLQPDFATVNAPHKLYRITRPVLTAQALRDGFTRGSPATRLPAGAGPAESPPQLLEQGLHALMQAYVPLTLLVNRDRQLLHAWGPTERWLRLPAGQANLDAVRMLPPQLAAVAGHAITQAMREQRAYHAPAVSLERDGQPLELRITARPLPAGQASESCVLLSLEEREATPAVRQEAPPFTAAELERLAGLERELAELRSTLQSTIEEMETANEELQATNEELMSSNEELQSTNEELQSVNEELYTVNAEYNAKLDLVNALNADLDGMSRATGIATIFVDQHLSLVRFTPEATLLFRLRPEDCGRAITDFKCQLDYPDLLQDLRTALAGPAPLEREIAGPLGVRYLARVLGYGDHGQGSRRAVLSLVDISRLRDAGRLQATLDALPEHIAVVDREGTIRQTNRAWREFAEANGGEAASTGAGTNYLASLLRSDTPEALEVLRGLQQVLAGQRDSLRLSYRCDSPEHARWFAMQVSPLGAGGDGGAVVAHFEVTPWAAPSQGDPADTPPAEPAP